MDVKESGLTYHDNRNAQESAPLFEPPPHWPLEEIRKAIPKHCFERSTVRAFGYLLRDLAIGGGAIWWTQSLVFTGLWILAHECGHRAFSSSGVVSDVVGFTLHSSLITPYWSWKITHHHHHMYHGSMERDELWIPDTRSGLGIPESHDEGVLEEYFGDSPMYCMAKLLACHFIAFQAYLISNLSGQRRFPKGTSHYNPYAVLFRDSQRSSIIWSDVGIVAALLVISRFSWRSVVPLYWIPWFGMSHWIVFLTFLHHTDPVVPRYRDGAWSYVRGAAATIDRDFLGWQGKFFMHGTSHWHVVHHYFPKLPFYNAAEATEHLKLFMGKHYVCSDTPIFQTFWYNWNHCRFVEDTGTVLFLRDKKGKYARRVAEDKQS
ncbi:hypothetical protein PHLGIDRAFT_28606 [Phlebiopsis gigantea 11061_1 CR5-6]|uniref:Fatty acid desaturase domain-containing protein n=1 Tax=Phlebiopsis gigantea (strain 11061_1 CR5-6) TaxID=745531 RepID=A0A0C3SE61_PHLG1|nr:hypothetical protein PHLGIDRAFT_28606 [Phlebiopsis gigantea 11061_1 CR5-6]